MNNDLKEILWIIKSCAMNYDKQEEGMHTFEWADLWILNEHIKELQQKVNQLEEENQRLKDIYTNTIRHLRKIGRDELASWMECQLHPCLGWTPMVSTTNEQKEYGSRDIRTGKLSRINTKE